MNKKRIIKIVTVTLLSAGMILYLFLTKEEPEADRIAREQHETLAAHSLEITPARPEYKTACESWIDSGFIVKIDRFSHQVWLNTAEWRSLTLKEKKHRIEVISEVLSEVDGTFQVIARDPENDIFLADYFANAMRLNENYLE